MVKLHFSRKYDGSARKQLKNNFRVESVRSVQLDTPHSILRNGVNGSFAPIGWPRKGGRNSDSTTQAKESSVCFLSGEQMPATGVDKWYNPDEGASNEVSSLANEKFITVPVTSMALKGKQYLLALGLPTGSRQTVLALWGYGLKRFDSLRVQINNRR